MRSSWNTVGRKPNDWYPKKRKEGKDFPSGHCREHEFNPCSGTFHKPCCAAKERERETGGQDQRQRDGEDGHVQMEAETGVVLPQAEHHQRPLDPGKGKEGLSPDPLQCVYPADTLILDF